MATDARRRLGRLEKQATARGFTKEAALERAALRLLTDAELEAFVAWADSPEVRQAELQAARRGSPGSEWPDLPPAIAAAWDRAYAQTAGALRHGN